MAPKTAAAGALKAPVASSKAASSSKDLKAPAPAKSKPGGASTSKASSTAPAPSKAPLKARPTSKATATKTASASAPGKKKAAAAPAQGSKAAAAAAEQQVSPAAAAPAADPPVLTEEQMKAKVEEALAKALADTEEIRKAAWQQQLEADRRKEAARRKKAEEEAKRKKEEARLRKACLEAAYDNEHSTLASLIKEAESKGIKNPVELSDAHGNTLLSEAAAGGALETVQLLLSRSANPNSQGEFKRTPLWRAAFLGHESLIPLLLEAGADPRIGDEQGQLPSHIATQPGVKVTLDSWDVTHTDQLITQWQDRQQRHKDEAVAAAQAAVRSAQEVADTAEQESHRCQQALRCARQELEKRISEYDLCVAEKKPDEITKVALDLIQTQEAAVAAAVSAAQRASEALDAARLALRDQQSAEREALGQQGGSGGGDMGDGEEPLPGTLIDIKALDEVLIRDVGGKLAASGHWPLLIDASGQASVFLRYMDSNYINALSSHNMEPDRLRRSILGAIRYGKPAVLDLMDVGQLWSELPAVFDCIQPGLLSALMDKSLLKNEAYLKLVKPTDGEEYEATRFQDARVARFVFIIHTSCMRPPAELLELTTPYRVNNRG